MKRRKYSATEGKQKIKVTRGDVDRRGEKTREIIRKREGMEHRKQ